jgi:hypothetical protein
MIEADLFTLPFQLLVDVFTSSYTPPQPDNPTIQHTGTAREQD